MMPSCHLHCQAPPGRLLTDGRQVYNILILCQVSYPRLMGSGGSANLDRSYSKIRRCQTATVASFKLTSSGTVLMVQPDSQRLTGRIGVAKLVIFQFHFPTIPDSSLQQESRMLLVNIRKLELDCRQTCIRPSHHHHCLARGYQQVQRHWRRPTACLCGLC